MDYSDLRNKTVFDFAEDEMLIREIISYYTKEEHLELIKNTPMKMLLHCLN
jgi:hypothetical protein